MPAVAPVKEFRVKKNDQSIFNLFSTGFSFVKSPHPKLAAVICALFAEHEHSQFYHMLALVLRLLLIPLYEQSLRENAKLKETLNSFGTICLVAGIYSAIRHNYVTFFSPLAPYPLELRLVGCTLVLAMCSILLMYTTQAAAGLSHNESRNHKLQKRIMAWTGSWWAVSFLWLAVITGSMALLFSSAKGVLTVSAVLSGWNWTSFLLGCQICVCLTSTAMLTYLQLYESAQVLENVIVAALSLLYGVGFFLWPVTSVWNLLAISMPHIGRALHAVIAKSLDHKEKKITVLTHFYFILGVQAAIIFNSSTLTLITYVVGAIYCFSESMETFEGKESGAFAPMMKMLDSAFKA